MKREHGSSLGYYTIGIAALFLAGFLLLVIFGAQSYRSAAAGQNENMRSRALLSYIATCIRSNDAENAVSVVSTEEGQLLSVTDTETGYALYIYLHDGDLVEEFVPAGRAPSPDDAEVIGQTDTFEITELTGGLLSVRTDEGRVLVRLRSEGGGA